jgi:pimeloyl-ACP methyl ester carboxylesterase
VYNDTSARHHSQLAAAAYCEPAVVQRWACESCELKLGDVSYFQSSILDAAGYVGTANEDGRPHLVVVFRGSTTDRNWVLDAVSAKHLRKAWGGGAVHLGFHEAYDTVQTYMHELLSMKRQQLIDARLIAPLDRVSVHLVGHSLGGALATLAAADLHTNRFFDVGALWTFGSPRVGDDQFASWLARSVLSGTGVTHWRVTHASDPVVHVPPVSMGFAHVPTEVWYPDEVPAAGCAKPYFLCDDRHEEDPLCSARIWLPLCIARSADHLSYVGVSYDHELNCADRLAAPTPPTLASRHLKIK